MWLWMTMAFCLKNLKFLLHRKPLMFLWMVTAAQVWVLLHFSSSCWYRSSLRNTYHRHTHTHIKTCWHAQSKSVSQTGHGGTLVSPSWYCPSSVQNMSSRATVCSLSDATGRRWVSSTPYLEHNTFFNLVFIQICVNFRRWMNLSWWK